MADTLVLWGHFELELALGTRFPRRFDLSAGNVLPLFRRAARLFGFSGVGGYAHVRAHTHTHTYIHIYIYICIYIYILCICRVDLACGPEKRNKELSLELQV